MYHTDFHFLTLRLLHFLAADISKFSLLGMNLKPVIPPLWARSTTYIGSPEQLSYSPMLILYEPEANTPPGDETSVEIMP